MIQFKLTGKISAGKNNMGVTRTGIHYPKKNFRVWRDKSVSEIQASLLGRKPIFGLPIDEPCYISINYTPADKRRRDIPALVDGIFHVLERAGIVADDCLFKTLSFTTKEPDKQGAGADISIEPLSGAKNGQNGRNLGVSRP